MVSILEYVEYGHKKAHYGDHSIQRDYQSVESKPSVTMKHDESIETEALRDKYHQFKREYEQRMRQEIQQEVEKIRNFEITTIRLDEAEKARQHVEEVRKELEKTYIEKLTKLREREQEIIEKFKSQLKNLELANEEQRLLVIKDIDTDNKVRAEKERYLDEERKAVTAERDRLTKMERELERRINNMDAEREAMKKDIEAKKKS